jgi:hypothetical protein
VVLAHLVTVFEGHLLIADSFVLFRWQDIPSTHETRCGGKGDELNPTTGIRSLCFPTYQFKFLLPRKL